MTYLLNAMAFLVDAAFGFYILLLMLRFLLQWARADFYHPLSQFILLMTNPPLRPMHRYMPHWRGFDSAALLLMLALQVLKRLLTHWLLGLKLSFLGTLVLAIADLVSLVLYVFLFSIMIQAVLSFFPESRHNPLYTFLYRLNEPLLRPARRRMQPVGGFDLAPLVVMLILSLCLMLIAEPLGDLGKRL
jgi:YggT family protein